MTKIQSTISKEAHWQCIKHFWWPSEKVLRSVIFLVSCVGQPYSPGRCCWNDVDFQQLPCETDIWVEWFHRTGVRCSLSYPEIRCYDSFYIFLASYMEHIPTWLKIVFNSNIILNDSFCLTLKGIFFFKSQKHIPGLLGPAISMAYLPENTNIFFKPYLVKKYQTDVWGQSIYNVHLQS